MEAYSLGEVNVDSLKEALLFLSTVYPFVDESAKDAFTAQVNGLDSSGNPTEGVVDQLHPTETPAETETAAEEATETPQDEHGASSVGQVPEGASAIGTATASSAVPEMSADERVASLEAQLADAKAAASQTPPETS